MLDAFKFLVTGLLPTHIFFNFPMKFYYCQKGEISDSFIGKITCVIRNVIKKTTYKTLLSLPSFFKFLCSCERLKMYLQTGAQEICAVLEHFSHFETAITRKPLEN